MDETTEVPSFDIADTMSLPCTKPCSIKHAGFCCNADERAQDCIDFGKALHQWTGRLKQAERYRQFLCFESVPAPGLAKFRVFFTQNGGLLGADALQGYIGWRPQMGSPGPHALAFKPEALPVRIILLQRPFVNGGYIFSGEGVARLLVFISKGKYSPFMWNMLPFSEYKMEGKGRCQVLSFGPAIDLRAVVPAAPVGPPKKTALEKATEELVVRMARKGISLSDDEVRQISQQVAPEYESDGDPGDSCSWSSMDSEDGGGHGDGSAREEEASAKYLKRTASAKKLAEGTRTFAHSSIQHRHQLRFLLLWHMALHCVPGLLWLPIRLSLASCSLVTKVALFLG